jgi:hypothetical protein
VAAIEAEDPVVPRDSCTGCFTCLWDAVAIGARPPHLDERVACEQQAQGELEVAEMVCCELRLVAAGVPNQWAAHDPGVVDEDV